MYDCIEWAGTQPWSSGKVGLLGISYYAITQWLVAGLNPPHLTAMVPWEGVSDFYRDMFYHGGMLCQAVDVWYRRTISTVQHGLGERSFVCADTGELVTGPETLTDEELAANRADYGADVRAIRSTTAFIGERSAVFDRITVPFLSAGNWGGAGTASARKRGGVRAGGIEPEVAGDPRPRALDRVLHRLRNQIAETIFGPLPQGQPTTAGTANRRSCCGYAPSTATSSTVRKTNGPSRAPNGRTGTSTPPRAPCQLEPAGRRRAGVVCGAGRSRHHHDDRADDRRHRDHRPRRRHPLRLVDHHRRRHLRWFCACSTPTATRSYSRAPSIPTPIGQGWLRASHRELDPDLSTPWRPWHTHTNPQPLTPGDIYRLDMEIWPTSIIVPTGHRIGLTSAAPTTNTKAPAAQLSHFKGSKLRGVGIYTHADPDHRPTDIYGGTTTLHTGPNTPPPCCSPTSRSRDPRRSANPLSGNCFDVESNRLFLDH